MRRYPLAAVGLATALTLGVGVLDRPAATADVKPSLSIVVAKPELPPATTLPPAPRALAAAATQPAPTAPATTSTTQAPAAQLPVIAFCGPGFDAPASEWQALAATVGRGALVAPPCTSYPYGQPPTWPMWDGTVRYAGLAPWTTAPADVWTAYLEHAEAVGVRVVAFDPSLWASPAPDLAGLPVHPALATWLLPEEPTTAEDAAALAPMAAALHAAGLPVWVNVFGTTTPEALAVVASLHPTLVSSDEYRSLDLALATDARLAAAVPGVPRAMAVSTLSYAADALAPASAERDGWVQAAAAQGAGVLWFGWRCPGLVWADGTPWTGGLYA